MNELTGQKMTAFLNDQITGHRGRIVKALAPLDPRSTFSVWLDTVRAIDEFINLPLFALEDDDAVEEAIVTFRLDVPELNKAALAGIRDCLAARFGEDITRRFIWTLMQAAAMYLAFRQHGLMDAASGLQTVGHAIGYFQSRRRHLVALLYTLPTACRGDRVVALLDTLNVFLLP
jgi:hypothetical protein